MDDDVQWKTTFGGRRQVALATEEITTVILDPHPAVYSQIIDMDVTDYDQNYERDASNLLSKLDLDHLERTVVEDKSIHELMRQYISVQSDTSP